MTKNEMIKEIADRINFTQVDVKAVVNTMEEIAFEQIKQHNEIKIFNGVTLEGVRRDARYYVNPNTGDKVLSSPRTFLKTKVGQHIKRMINE